MKILLLIFSILLSLMATAGTEGGGGGGGICTLGKCLTLAEAGLRIDTTATSQFEIELDVIDEVKWILKKVPYSEIIELSPKVVIGNINTFVRVRSHEEVSLEQFKKEYLALLEKENFPSQGFKLLAVSKQGISRSIRPSVYPGDRFDINRGTTYILPDYELLNKRAKALLLIHEALIRYYSLPVKLVLEFDGIVLDYLNALETGREGNFDRWSLINFYRKAFAYWYEQLDRSPSYMTPAERSYYLGKRVILNNELVGQMIKNTDPLPLEEICPGETPETPTGHYRNWVKDLKCKITREKALELRRYRPDFAKYLSDELVDVQLIDSNLLMKLNEKEDWIKTMKDSYVRVPCSKNPNIRGHFYTPLNVLMGEYWNLHWYSTQSSTGLPIVVLNKCPKL